MVPILKITVLCGRTEFNIWNTKEKKRRHYEQRVGTTTVNWELTWQLGNTLSSSELPIRLPFKGYLGLDNNQAL